MAILTTDWFDATTVDASAVRFGPTGSTLSGGAVAPVNAGSSFFCPIGEQLVTPSFAPRAFTEASAETLSPKGFAVEKPAQGSRNFALASARIEKSSACAVGRGE